MPPILIPNCELSPLLILLRGHKSRFFKSLTVTTCWLELPQTAATTRERGLDLRIAGRKVVWPVESGAWLRKRSVGLVEVQGTVGFSRCCPLEWTVCIDATHALSRSRRGSCQTSVAETVPKRSEVTCDLEFRRTHSVHRAPGAECMAQIFLVKLLRTCKSVSVLLRQRAGEWTSHMMRTSGWDTEEILGPTVGSKWVQH